MSQITRCPSCATSFKVVADQLRISEGWVRCGQCKEVFDASAHLLPVAPAALLPDVSLIDVRPPTAPVARKADDLQVWGGRASAPVERAQSRVVGGGALPDPPWSAAPVFRDAETAPPAVPALPVPVLDIPGPTVPAFLAAGGNSRVPGEEVLSLAPVTPFAWRSPPLPVPAAVSALTPLAPPYAPEVAPLSPPVATLAPQGTEALHSASALESREDKGRLEPIISAGYELPFADLRDSGWPAEVPAVDVAEAAVISGGIYPALELPAAPTLSVRPPGVERDAPMPSASMAELSSESLPSVDFVRPPVAEAPATLALAEVDSSAAVPQAGSRRSSREPVDAEALEDEVHEADQEVSFVVAARRKAFWRKPAVRGMLVLMVLLGLLGLALQTLVQERDRIVAMDARARPWLMRLCGALRCEIAPQRQIADVVIDSSSFNKARGDSYQLALSMKSKAAIPLAMPAVELTLTDAQDQPVLRRVLLPTDMAAPAELSARGEWSTSVSVIVTTGGARVAGYRLLAFYP